MYIVNIVTAFLALTYLPITFLITAYIFLYLNKAHQLHNILSCIVTEAIFFLMMLILDVIVTGFLSFEQISQLRETIPYNIINSILFIIISLLMIALLNIISNRIHGINSMRSVTNNTGNKKILYCFATGILLIALIISTIWMIGYFDEQHIKYYIFFGGVISGIIVIFMVVSIIVISQAIEQKAKILEAQKDKEITELYKNEISAMYDNIRDFKHDYMKIFSSVSVLLEQNRIDELKTYFNSEILSLHDKTLSDFNNDIHTLTNITDSIVQGVIYSYIIKAKHMNINLSIDIQEKIHQHPDISSLDMSRIFGILLDNAFEAAGETNDKKVLFGAVISGSQTIYVVKNQYSVPPDISKIFNPEYSTKGDEHGRGLFIAKKITDKYDNVFFNISLQDGWFVSEIIVE